MTKLTKRQYAIIDEASDWAVRLDGEPLSNTEQEDFADWLLISAEHVQEFLYAVATFQALGDIDAPERVPVDILLANKAPDVIPLFQKTARQVTSPAKPKRLRKLSLIAATVALMVISATSYFTMETDLPLGEMAYSTVTGEQRSVSLSDGSVIYLNTRSKVLVRYQDNERTIKLLEGEALFKVAHDPARPFRVYAGTAVAEALGTIFNVYLKADQTNVAVVEGKVAVSASHDPVDVDKFSVAASEPLFLTSGQETDVTLQGVIQDVRTKQAELITSWRERRLIFEGENLATIAKEFNRYNTIKIIIDDLDLVSVEFDGVFDADNPEAFIRFLKLTSGIDAHRTSKNEIHLKRVSEIPTSRTGI